MTNPRTPRKPGQSLHGSIHGSMSSSSSSHMNGHVTSGSSGAGGLLTESDIRCLHGIRQRTELLKFGHRGEPKFRDFWISEDFKTLKWDSKTKSAKKTQLKIADIQKLEIGQKTAKFKKQGRTDLEHLSFSLVFKNGLQRDSLDLVCKDRMDYNNWIPAMQALIEKRIDPKSIPKDDYPDSTRESGPSHLRKQTAYSVHERKAKKKKRAAFEGANDVFSFGWNEWGQLGLGHQRNVNMPTLSQPLLGIGVNQVACGWAHTTVLLASNAVLQFGNRVGTGFKEDLLKPRTVAFPHNPKISSVSCGDYHSVALSEDGSIYTWGTNSFGQLGHGDFTDRELPKRVDALTDYQMYLVECGSNGSVAIDVKGSVYTWGCGRNGFLGHNSEDDESTPRQVTDLQGCIAVNVACGDSHVLIVTERQSFTWGCNDCGQLGLGQHTANSLRPTRITIAPQGTVEWIACGAAHSCAIVQAPDSGVRKLYVWGSNHAGQLGFPKTTEKLWQPTCHTMPDKHLIQVECGSNHTILLTKNTEVLSAGSNAFGERGIGNVLDEEADGKFTPVKAVSDKQIRAIACGGVSTCALAPRAWVNDEEVTNCMAQKCGAAFTLVNRRHHCRNCGGIFCNQCSSKSIAILAYDYKEPVRVCDKCYKQLYNAKFE